MQIRWQSHLISQGLIELILVKLWHSLQYCAGLGSFRRGISTTASRASAGQYCILELPAIGTLPKTDRIQGLIDEQPQHNRFGKGDRNTLSIYPENGFDGESSIIDPPRSASVAPCGVFTALDLIAPVLKEWIQISLRRVTRPKTVCAVRAGSARRVVFLTGSSLSQRMLSFASQVVRLLAIIAPFCQTIGLHRKGNFTLLCVAYPYHMIPQRGCCRVREV